MTESKAFLYHHDHAPQDRPADCPACNALTHPEAQGNKDLGEPQTSFAWQKIETAPQAQVLLYAPPEKLYSDPKGRLGVIHIARPSDYVWATHWAPLPPPPSERSEAAPTSSQPIKGESELESASNGMGLR